MNMKILLFTILLFSASALHAQGTVKSYSIQVSFIKTIHIIFPGAIKYVDLGSGDIIAAKASGAENVLRVKAAVENFCDTTNISVICEDGTFYSFIVSYAQNPTKLNILISDEIFSSKYDEISSRQVNAIMQAIYIENKNNIKYVGRKLFSVQMLIKSIYIHEDLYFIHLYIRNTSNVGLDIDILRFKITDKKLVKRTAIQETYIKPLKSFNEQRTIEENSIARAVYVLPKFTISSDKIFIVQLIEKGGARNLTIQIESEDFYNAKTIENLKLR